MRINKNLLQILFIIAGLTLVSACQKSGAVKSDDGRGSGSGGGNTPTEAYKNLYNAVKSKNMENIKANLSKATVEFALGVAEMQKKTPEEMFKNGLLQSTMADTFPPIRNERVKGNMGALEARMPDGNWEDVPFILEDERWKMAWGDVFKGTYQKPAPAQAETEANNNVPQVLPGPAITNTNMNAGPKIPTDKKQPAANKP